MISQCSCMSKFYFQKSSLIRFVQSCYMLQPGTCVTMLCFEIHLVIFKYFLSTSPKWTQSLNRHKNRINGKPCNKWDNQTQSESYHNGCYWLHCNKCWVFGKHWQGKCREKQWRKEIYTNIHFLQMEKILELMAMFIQEQLKRLKEWYRTRSTFHCWYRC